MPEIFQLNSTDGFISVWQLDEDLSFFENQINNSIAVEIKKLFDNEKRQKEKIAPHFILHCFDPSVTLTNFNRKPEASNGYISVSHSQQLLAVYFSLKSACGIDIEHLGSRILRIKHKFMNQTELHYCGENIHKCLVVWAAKEALFKKYGGDTAFFAEKIAVNAFEIHGHEFKIGVDFEFNSIERHQIMNCVMFKEFVMVYTV